MRSSSTPTLIVMDSESVMTLEMHSLLDTPHAPTVVKPLSSWADGDGADRLRVAFDAAALSLTVGAEKELMLVDHLTNHLLPAIGEVLGRMDGGRPLPCQQARDARANPTLRPPFSMRSELGPCPLPLRSTRACCRCPPHSPVTTRCTSLATAR